MSLSSFAYTLSLFWLIVHIVHRLLSRKHQTPSITLPFSRLSSSGRSRSSWSVALHLLHVRIETTRWNDLHDRLINRLKKRRTPVVNAREMKAEGRRARMWAERVYGVGFVVAVLGMGAALVLLMWTTWTLVGPLAAERAGSKGGAGRLVRRQGEEAGMESPITPIIPGVTVPVNHIPFIFVSLFVSQITHELGHAVAGALYGVPILSSGASIIVCIPAAFVAFSSEKLDSLRPATKARITAAGPFHNLLFWGFWVVLGWAAKSRDGMLSGVGLKWVGYRDVSAVGRVVLAVDEASPLVGYLMPGTIVTKLDDHSMASSEENLDPWSSFLKSSPNGEMGFGWCLDAAELGSSSKECCLPDEPTLTSLSCFAANTTPIQLGCLNPVPILTSTDESARCYTKDGCKDELVCVRPTEKERLLRLTVMNSEEGREEVVLWTGPWEEIYDGVTVGKWLPKFSFLPLGLPLWFSTFWEYMVMVNLSLFLFNLVPIAGLDGSHLLRSIFVMMKERGAVEAYDLEALERGDIEDALRDRHALQNGFLERIILRGAGILVALDLVLVGLALIRT